MLHSLKSFQSLLYIYITVPPCSRDAVRIHQWLDSLSPTCQEEQAPCMLHSPPDMKGEHMMLDGAEEVFL